MTLPSLLGVAGIPGILGLRDALSKEEEKSPDKNFSLPLSSHGCLSSERVPL